jgi:transcriptional regulator with PAS, ATPase and Fis domain
MEKGRFREDLFYRLNVFTIHIPPLRDRKDDIPFLARYFLEREGRALDRPVPQISDQAWSFIMNYDWPGNVRELENSIERAFAICEHNIVMPHDLPPEVTERGLPRLAEGLAEGYPEEMTLEEVEARHIQRVLSKHRGNLIRTAEGLGISRTTLWRKIKKYGLSVTK